MLAPGIANATMAAAKTANVKAARRFMIPPWSALELPGAKSAETVVDAVACV
jgi:hypothetical protein